MRYNGFSYLMGEGFRNVFKNPKSSVTSIVTMICTMFLFGLAFAIGMNVNSILEQVQMKQGMQIFIWDETTDEQKQQFEDSIKAMEGVNTCIYKNKAQALEDFKEQMKDYKEFLEGLEGENNIFPASFVVTLTDLTLSDKIQGDIEKLGAKIATEGRSEEIDLGIEETTQKDSIIKDITSSNNTISTLIVIANGIRYAVIAIFVILLVISVTIISNTIRLTVHARRKEISIMKYVGATNGFIRTPFIVEGILIGIIAALITILLVGGIYDVVVKQIEASNVLQKMGILLLSFKELAQTIVIVYAVLGIGIGIIGSSMSMKKYLEV